MKICLISKTTKKKLLIQVLESHNLVEEEGEEPQKEVLHNIDKKIMIEMKRDKLLTGIKSHQNLLKEKNLKKGN